MAGLSTGTGDWKGNSRWKVPEGKHGTGGWCGPGMESRELTEPVSITRGRGRGAQVAWASIQSRGRR